MKYIVNDDYEFVYFVVQKVACTSLKTALLPLFGPANVQRERLRGRRAEDLDVHARFDGSSHQIDKRQLLRGIDGEYREYFKFAFVRNPWDRLVSCYFDKMAEGRPGFRSPPGIAGKLRVGMPFAAFVEAVCSIPDEESNMHFKSQHKMVCGPARRGRPVMADFVGRFENLAGDFGLVATEIGARELRLPHLWRSEYRRYRPYTDFYDDRLRDMVHERYGEDIQIFGYTF